MSITALTVCKDADTRQWDGLQRKTLVGRHFQHSGDVQKAWFDAVALVDTDHFFFIDDTDELPEDYASVLEQAVERSCALVYTDELVVSQDGKRSVTHSLPYSQALHINKALLVHHLALCETSAALAAIKKLPQGKYWPELLLYWQLAKKSVCNIERVGYIWNRSPNGLHLRPFTTIGIVRSQLWCLENP